MRTVQPTASVVCATLIGDVVGSRDVADRGALHSRLSAALRESQRAAPAASALRITVGDEFQGSYDTLGKALDAVFRIRLRMLPVAQVRFGLSWGEASVLDKRTHIQDGPAWWAAREAIEAAKTAQQRAATHAVRTVFRAAQDDAPSAGAINAALLCQDQLISSLDDRALRILIALAAGESRTSMARAEDISASAISQRIVSGGLEVIVAAAGELASVR